MVRKTSPTYRDFYYYSSHTNPSLLIHSGTHGDEWQVISLVKEALTKYESRLPPFIFFPEVSPSAVKRHTRVNARGQDMNRTFFSNSKEPEVRENIKYLKNKHFELMVTFHEDPTTDEYYIYDVCRSKERKKAILRHNKRLGEAGIKLFTGVDDPDDPELGYEFKNGYRKFVYDEGQDNGMITIWAVNRGIVKDCMVPEIPGKLDIKKKRFIVESFIEDVLLAR